MEETEKLVDIARQGEALQINQTEVGAKKMYIESYGCQ